MKHEESTFELIAKGALAGIAGTAALTVGMQVLPQLLAPLGLAGYPVDDRPEEPNVNLVEKATLALWGAVPGETTKTVGGQFVHWGYGATWGVLYGLTQHQLPLTPQLQGLLLGTVVGTVASTVVPALELSPPPTRQPRAETIMMTGLQLLYGWVTAQTFAALSSSNQVHTDYARHQSSRGPYGVDPAATRRYPGQPDGAAIERRFRQVDAPMPRHQHSLAEPRGQYEQAP